MLCNIYFIKYIEPSTVNLYSRILKTLKTNISTGKRVLAIILATVYIFAMSTYIVFLSSRTHVHHHRHHVSAQTQRLSQSNPVGNFYDKQHGAFKSTFQNNRRVIVDLYSFICVAILALVPRLRFFYIDRFADKVTGLMYAGRPHYLSLGILRI